MSEQDKQDRKLWRELTRDVAPLVQAAKVSPARKLKLDLKSMRERDHQSVMQEAMAAREEPEDWNAGDENEYRQDGISSAVLRKLRRGQIAPQATLDLHGLKSEEAHQATQALLQQAKDRDWRCVKIIHGKGLRSAHGKPVLKNRVQLSLLRTQDVLAFCSAPAWEGGHGAVLVLLKKGP
jgi:DNA-nicking Smr family endonuclease